MPRVPTYDGPQVAERPLQPVLQGPIDASSGMAALGQTIAGLGQTLDRAQMRDAETEANTIDTEVTAGWLAWDAQARRKYQGQNVKEYEAEAAKWWDDARAQYGAKASPLAKQAVGQALGRKRNQAMGAVMGHVGAELERHADQQAESAAQTSIEFGIDTGDPAGAAARVRQISAEKGARKGWTTEQVQAEQQRLLGTLHLAYITRLVDTDAEGARRYAEAHKDEIPAMAQVKLEAVLKGSEDNEFAQRFAAKAAAKPLAEQLAEAADIADPQRREKTLLQIRQNHAMVKEAQREREAAASDQAWQLVGQGKRVPELVLQQMDGHGRVQLQDYLRQRAKQAASGEKVKTDWETYIDLRTRLAAGEQVDLRPYTTKIAGPQMEQLLDIQTKGKDPKKQPEVVSMEQQLRAAATELKLSGAKKEEERGQFHNAAHELFNEHLKRTGKEPTYDERQAMLDKLITQVVTHEGWFLDTKKPLYTLPREQRGERLKFEAGKVYRDPVSGERRRYTSAGTWEPAQ